MRPDLIIARHGETEWNRIHRFQGKADSPLTAVGRQQAQDLTALLQDEGVVAGSHAIYTSPQGRSVATAALALDPLGLSASEDPRLVEICVGAWTGLSRTEIDAKWPAPDPEEHWLDRYERAPEGEGFAALFARCAAFLEELERPAVVFTHGITSRVLRALALGLSRADLDDLPGGQGCLHIIRDGQHLTRTP